MFCRDKNNGNFPTTNFKSKMQNSSLVLLVGLENYMLPCFTKKILGFDCPGCGLQRSALFLIKGDFKAAFEIYPAIFPMLLLFGFLIISKFATVKNSNQITIALMVTTVGFIVTNYILKFI